MYLQKQVDLLQLVSDLLPGSFLRLSAVLLGLALVHHAALQLSAQTDQLILQLPVTALQLVVAPAQSLHGRQLFLQLPVGLLQSGAA